jgi:hypothetical protein
LIAQTPVKPSSAARAVASGAPFIERVDLLVKLISHQLGMPNPEIDRTVQAVDQTMRGSCRGGIGVGVRWCVWIPDSRFRGFRNDGKLKSSVCGQELQRLFAGREAPKFAVVRLMLGRLR